MRYHYFENRNYEDFAGGKVIYHKPGYTNFPVRLAGEIYMTCLHILNKQEGKTVVYDPCCGTGYLLTVLGFLCGDYISSIYASDISVDIVALAQSNLNLLHPEGLLARKMQLKELYQKYNKPSHLAAINSVESLANLINCRDTLINCTTFSADVMNHNALSNQHFKADIVITDVPYGNLVTWADKRTSLYTNDCSPVQGVLLKHCLNHVPPIDTLLHNITRFLHEDSVVAICSDKSQKIANPQFRRVKKIQAGKRKIEFFQVNPAT